MTMPPLVWTPPATDLASPKSATFTVPRDHAVKSGIGTEIHRRHSAPRDPRVDVVPAAKQLAHGWRKGGVHRQQCRGRYARLNRLRFGQLTSNGRGRREGVTPLRYPPRPVREPPGDDG